MLAAHVAAAYASLVTQLDDESTDGNQLGWRFLEKMIQLPVVVPRPSPDQAAHYITDLLPPESDRAAPQPDTRATASAADDATRPSEAESESSEQPTPSTSIDLGPSEKPRESAHEEGFGRIGSIESSISVRRERIARNLASEPAFHEACKWSAENLVPDLNPRQLKRLLAMIELHSLIANRLGYLDFDDSKVLARQLQEIGVLAALQVRWPHLVDRLLAPPPEDPHGRLLVEQILEEPEGRPAADYPWLKKDLCDFLIEHSEAVDTMVRLTTLEPST
jgi:hypothetical protein